MEEAEKDAVDTDPEESKPPELESDLSCDVGENGQLLSSATPTDTPTESNSISVQSSRAARLSGLPVTLLAKIKMVQYICMYALKNGRVLNVDYDI